MVGVGRSGGLLSLTFTEFLYLTEVFDRGQRSFQDKYTRLVFIRLMLPLQMVRMTV